MQQLGRYRLVEKLGGGGMGVVYRAVLEGPKGFARPVAVKRIAPQLARDPGFSELLAAEARLCALLRHPNIVQVYELGIADGECFLAMEYVDGWDLMRVVRRCRELQRQLPVGVVLHLVGEIAAALAHAHTLVDGEGRPLSIVHRDVSPSNVMVTPAGSAKLVDFGIAKAASHVRDEQTRTGTLKGKLGYMSPEQADGLRVDHRTDLFSLGVVAWECLTLERLFRGDDDLHTLRLVRHAEVPLPSSLRPDVASDVDDFVMKLLARDRDARFATGEAVIEALAPIVHRLHGDAATTRKFLTELALPSVAQPIVEAVPLLPATLPAMLPVAASETSPIVSPPTVVATPARPPSTRPYQPPPRRWPVALAAVAVIGTVAAITAHVTTRATAAVVPASAPSPTSASSPERQVIVTPLPAPEPPLKGEAPPPVHKRPPPAPRFGTLRFKAVPWAEVRVDGKLIGTTPLAPRRVPAGRHEVVLTFRARSDKRMVVVRGDDDQLVSADLR